MPLVDCKYRRPQLRNRDINYQFGWFFVTFQVAANKSELGAIVGEKCVLNKLGEAVKGLIETLGDYNPEVRVDTFVVMPNHVHLILKIARGATPSRPENKGATPSQPENSGAVAPPISGSGGVMPSISGSGGVMPSISGSGAVAPRVNNLGRIIGKLKSLASREYRLLKEKGLARDIGSKLWQANYWEKIVTDHDQLEAIRAYIAENPKRWSTDRFGPVTTHSLGNLELLNEPLVGFVASEDAKGDAFTPREWKGRNLEERGCHALNLGPRGCHAPPEPPVISTFTSPQERMVLRRLLAKGRRFIAIYPGGIPAALPSEIAARVADGRALLLSPVESGTGVNKQRAIWCNEYVIRRAKQIWCGYIRPGGTLEAILKGVGEGTIIS